MNDWYVNNFSHEEVACECCGKTNMAEHTIMKFQVARDYLGLPIYGTSWCRCEKHNAEVGGKFDSAHLITDAKECEAGDVTLVPSSELRPMTSHERFKLVEALMHAGFTRLGLHPFYVHADNASYKTELQLWLY